ncbi:MAG TPA: matrixin family metalloprotease [Candidatus Thermoplasmatota archaeon]|jgi:hypothetical protein|nr:matrixin family metalloprotease [Candidatus Thermoplasmatota archaeon]
MRWILATFVVGSVMVSMSAAGHVGSTVGSLMPWETLECPDTPTAESLTYVFPDPTDPLGVVTVHLLCYAPAAPGADACTSSAYALTGWSWPNKVSMKVDPTNSGLSATGVVSAFGSSGSAWDQATGASIWGGVTQNTGGASAGKKDGTNQIGFKMGGGNTIAVTYTWSSGGTAVESDGKYNTQFPWSLTGEANKMDVQNIGTHEIGHTFGLGHPANTPANSCLTMYAYADYGETQKRSLETGDKNGIGAIYG